MIQASHCADCGASLEEIEGTIGQIAQEVDIPPIIPLTTEYQQVIKVCACGHCNCPPLPIEGYATIGRRMGALITYFNVEHALPYDWLSQITHDLLGFAISEGTIANKLAHMQRKAKGITQIIKQNVMDAAWIGSDESSTLWIQSDPPGPTGSSDYSAKVNEPEKRFGRMECPPSIEKPSCGITRKRWMP